LNRCDKRTLNLSATRRSEILKAMSTTSPPLFDPLRFVAPVKAAKSRDALIAEIAYYRAQSRGFEPGHEVEDWLAAEAEIDKRKP